MFLLKYVVHKCIGIGDEGFTFYQPDEDHTPIKKISDLLVTPWKVQRRNPEDTKEKLMSNMRCVFRYHTF